MGILVNKTLNKAFAPSHNNKVQIVQFGLARQIHTDKTVLYVAELVQCLQRQEV